MRRRHQGQDVLRPANEQERERLQRCLCLDRRGSEEAAANDFAARYPASELRSYLYSSAMLLYQRENNSPKMLAMGEKVLELDPDHPLALVLTATALADSLGDRDRDREKKIGTIKRNATRAIQTAETGYAATPLTPRAVRRQCTKRPCKPWPIQRWGS